MSHDPTPMTPLPDYYEILQVHPKASPAVIKKAYRTLLLELGHHPDQGGDPAVAALITEAYQVLSDVARRAEYDQAYFADPAARTAPRAAEPSKAPTAGTALVVRCARCRTKNRVKSHEVLALAVCSQCGHKLNQPTGLTTDLLDRARRAWRRVAVDVAEAAQARDDRPGTPGGPKRPPQVVAMGVPLLLLVASGVAITYTLAPAALVGDPIQVADRLQKEARPDEARRVLREALERDPANPALHEKLGETCLKQALFPEAAGHFAQAAAYNPDNAHVLARQGRALYLMNDLDSAEHVFKQAVRIDPNYTPALFDLGNIHAKRERYSEAARYYEAALEKEPGADLYYNLGLVQKQSNQPEKAIRAFKAALVRDPNHRPSMVQLAEIFNGRGDFALAAAQYVTASQLKHQDVDLHLKLANLYEKTGQTRLAIREWNTAMAQGKDNPVIVERARRALSKLGAAPAS